MNKKVKPKLDKWFLVVLAILLWTLATQLFNLALLVSDNPANFNLWARIIGSGIAIYGAVWVIRIYIGSAIKKARKARKIEEAIEAHPELEELINDLTKGETV